MRIRYLLPSCLLILANMLFSLHAEQHLFPPYHLLRPLLTFWLVLGILAMIVKRFVADWMKVEESLVVIVLLFALSPIFFWVTVRLLALVYVSWQIYSRLPALRSRKTSRLPLLLIGNALLVVYSIGLNLSEYRNVTWSSYFSSLRNLRNSNASLPLNANGLKPDI